MAVSSSPGRRVLRGRSTVRRFETDDLRRILVIERSAFPPRLAYTADRFQRLFALHPDGFWVAADSTVGVVGDIVAYVQRGIGEIDTIAVDEAYRGRGVGRQLMDKAVRFLARQGASSAALEVAASNLVAQAFFEKLGFRRIRKLANYYGVGQHAYRMRRALVKPARQ